MGDHLDSQDSNSSGAAENFFLAPDTQTGTGRVRNVVASRPQELFSYRVTKRLFDVAAVLLMSPFLLIVMGVIATAVRLSSPGPIFFSHRRIRGHGAFFSMWKFRTMCVDSQEVLDKYLASHPEAKAEWRRTHKLQNDPRVTKVGAFLRKTSLDELPQFWNVLSGSMSVVGPRPIVAAEVEKYGEYFADYCAVKPGITGLWQVSGRSKVTYAERVQLDRRYAREWTFTGDLRIILKTLTSVVNQDGAW